MKCDKCGYDDKGTGDTAHVCGLLKAGNYSDKGYEVSTHEKQKEFADKRNEEEYDVVIDALQERRDRLWKMTQQNMNSDMFNIMDQIRLDQIDQLDRAIQQWKKSKE